MPIKARCDMRTKQKREIDADSVISNLKGKTFAEVDAYVENQVTDLASAKQFLKVLAKIVLYLLKRS